MTFNSVHFEANMKTQSAALLPCSRMCKSILSIQYVSDVLLIYSNHFSRIPTYRNKVKPSELCSFQDFKNSVQEPKNVALKFDHFSAELKRIIVFKGYVGHAFRSVSPPKPAPVRFPLAVASCLPRHSDPAKRTPHNSHNAPYA